MGEDPWPCTCTTALHTARPPLGPACIVRRRPTPLLRTRARPQLLCGATGGLRAAAPTPAAHRATPRSTAHHDIPPREVLHDQVQEVLVLEGVEQLDHVRRVHLCQHVALRLDVLNLCGACSEWSSTTRVLVLVLGVVGGGCSVGLCGMCGTPRVGANKGASCSLISQHRPYCKNRCSAKGDLRLQRTSPPPSQIPTLNSSAPTPMPRFQCPHSDDPAPVPQF